MTANTMLRPEYNYVELPGPLAFHFPTNIRVWILTWARANAQALLSRFRSEYQKITRSGVVEEASILLLKEPDFSTLSQVTSQPRVRDGHFRMGATWVGNAQLLLFIAG